MLRLSGHDVKTCLSILAARYARVVARNPSPLWRAWGMPGARCTRSLVCKGRSTRGSHHGYTGSPGIPARNGFNGFLRNLPGDRALLSPSPAEISSADLTPASRRQDHTTSPSASAPFVKSASASTASLPYVRDDRETPLCVGGDGGGCRGDLGRNGIEIFFETRLDRWNRIESLQ